MEDGNRLELTLSLPCGSSNEANDRDSKLIDDFKNFLDGGTQRPSSGVGSRRSDSLKPEENLFFDLTSNTDTSTNSNKRKNLFDESNHEKKREKETHLADLHDKARTSHVSITTDEGSTAENEDVADSEAEGSSSRLVRKSDGSKEVHGACDSSSVASQGQGRFSISLEKEFKAGNLSFGVPFPSQSANVLTTPYCLPVKELSSNPVLSTGVVQVMAGDKAVTQPVIPANLPLMFRYSSVNSVSIPVVAQKTYDSVQHEGKNGKEEGSSATKEEDLKRSAKNPTELPQAEGFHSEYPAIKPGMAADLKFGGSGSAPNLPWVSTTGTGPNGRTISGVTYRYSPTQIQIVCACHGSHMSPEEFIQHADEEQLTTNAGSGGLSTFPSSNNPATSAQS